MINLRTEADVAVKLVIFARHTQSGDNAAQVHSGGGRNPPLTAKGEEQAQGLKRRILVKVRGSTTGAIKLALGCSDLKRAMQAAAPLVDLCPIRFFDPGLREVSVGDMEGLTKEEAGERFSDVRHNLRNPEFDFTDIGGESARQVIERFVKTLRRVLSHCETDGATALIVVSHGLILRLFGQRVLNVSTEHEQGDFVSVPFGTVWAALAALP